jgi:hypothetical protein
MLYLAYGVSWLGKQQQYNGVYYWAGHSHKGWTAYLAQLANFETLGERKGTATMSGPFAARGGSTSLKTFLRDIRSSVDAQVPGLLELLPAYKPAGQPMIGLPSWREGTPNGTTHVSTSSKYVAICPVSPARTPSR